MFSTAISARAAFAVAVIVGPAWGVAAECRMQSTALATVERCLKASPPAASHNDCASTVIGTREASSPDAQRLRLDEFADRHFLTYLQLKENP